MTFLKEYEVKFQQNFFLFDTALNSSEIKIIHLNIPKDNQNNEKKIENQIEIKKIINKTSEIIINKLSIEDYWLIPIINSEKKKFILKKNNNLYLFNDFETDNTLLSSNLIEIFMGKIKIGQIKKNLNNLFCGITSITPSIEICALNILNNNLFEIAIPTIKKIEGKNFIFPIIFNENNSLILLNLKKQSRDSISFKYKLPLNKNNLIDYTYEGLFNNNNKYNFILIFEPKPNKNILTMSLIKDNIYEVNYGYPFSPLQAFISCIFNFYIKDL